MDVVDVKNNGFDPTVVEKLQKTLNISDFDGAFASQHLASAIEKFVERGDKLEDLILRGDFPSEEKLLNILLLYADAEDFECDWLKKLLMNLMAGYPAIQGKRIDILKQAVIGQLDSDRKRRSLKSMMGMGEDRPPK